MTEEEAKTKWCPHSRNGFDNYDGHVTGGLNRGKAKDDCLCIASDCMMWKEYKDEFIGMENGSTVRFENSDVGGYCSLGGK